MSLYILFISLFHIYNRGNNRQKIFFHRDNYLFFLQKINIHIKPHAEILAWCLMPNHFHFLIFIANDEKAKEISLGIKVLLRSYTRAINIQENRVGSLFTQNTNSKALTDLTEMRYVENCFDYIHQNPMQAGLAKNAEDWEFSSFSDYIGKRNGKLVNKEFTEKFVRFPKNNEEIKLRMLNSYNKEISDHIL